MGNLTSSFTISFLSGTDSLYVEENVVKFEDDSSAAESAGSLLQVYYTDTGTVTPDWTESTNQPCLKLGLTKSSDGSNITLTEDCTFKYQGTALSFSGTYTLNGLTWHTDTTGQFAYAYDSDMTYVYLRVIANIASAELTTNQQIEYTLAYSDTTFGSSSVTSTTDILCREGSSSSVYCNILTDNSELSSEATSTELSVQYIYGGVEYSSVASLNTKMGTSYTLSWYKDGVALGIYTETLTVYREEDDDSTTGNYVDGCNVFSVMVLDASGNIIASDSQRLTDVADEYQVKLTQTGTIRSNKSATVQGILYQGDEAYTGSVTYTTTVYNANNEVTGAAATATSASGFSRAISSSECAYENSDGETEYGDCLLAVTCNF